MAMKLYEMYFCSEDERVYTLAELAELQQVSKSDGNALADTVETYLQWTDCLYGIDSTGRMIPKCEWWM